jgi:hypothetical protein
MIASIPRLQSEFHQNIYAITPFCSGHEIMGPAEGKLKDKQSAQFRTM